MKTQKPNPELIDEENPEWTTEDFKKAVPFYEMFPQFKPVAKKEAKHKKIPTGQLKAA